MAIGLFTTNYRNGCFKGSLLEQFAQYLLIHSYLDEESGGQLIDQLELHA